MGFNRIFASCLRNESGMAKGDEIILESLISSPACGFDTSARRIMRDHYLFLIQRAVDGPGLPLFHLVVCHILLPGASEKKNINPFHAVKKTG